MGNTMHQQATKSQLTRIRDILHDAGRNIIKSKNQSWIHKERKQVLNGLGKHKEKLDKFQRHHMYIKTSTMAYMCIIEGSHIDQDINNR